MREALLAIFATSLLASPTYARCKVDISRYVGWSIVYSGTITGYIDEDGEKKDAFEGCEHGRRLVVDYTKAVTCNTYSYSYAYHPDVVILTKGDSAVACIDDEIYDILL
jgi:hypothetical protein